MFLVTTWKNPLLASPGKNPTDAHAWHNVFRVTSFVVIPWDGTEKSVPWTNLNAVTSNTNEMIISNNFALSATVAEFYLEKVTAIEVNA